MRAQFVVARLRAQDRFGAMDIALLRANQKQYAVADSSDSWSWIRARADMRRTINMSDSSDAVQFSWTGTVAIRPEDGGCDVTMRSSDNAPDTSVASVVARTDARARQFASTGRVAPSRAPS